MAQCAYLLERLHPRPQKKPAGGLPQAGLALQQPPLGRRAASLLGSTPARSSRGCDCVRSLPVGMLGIPIGVLRCASVGVPGVAVGMLPGLPVIEAVPVHAVVQMIAAGGAAGHEDAVGVGQALRAHAVLRTVASGGAVEGVLAVAVGPVLGLARGGDDREQREDQRTGTDDP